MFSQEGAERVTQRRGHDVFKRDASLAARSAVIYATATPGIFGVPTYAAPLREVVKRKGIDARYSHVLTEVRPQLIGLSATQKPLERIDRKSTRLNSSHTDISRMPSSA